MNLRHFVETVKAVWRGTAPDAEVVKHPEWDDASPAVLGGVPLAGEVAVVRPPPEPLVVVVLAGNYEQFRTFMTDVVHAERHGSVYVLGTTKFFYVYDPRVLNGRSPERTRVYAIGTFYRRPDAQELVALVQARRFKVWDGEEA